MIQAARNCLKRMSLHYHTVSKNLYIDGNERKDVVKYCQSDFLLIWARLERCMVVFSKNKT